MGVISFVRLCFQGYLKSAVQAIQYSGTEAEYFGHLLLFFSMVVVGGWTRTKTSDQAPCHFACIVVTTSQGHNNLLLSG